MWHSSVSDGAACDGRGGGFGGEGNGEISSGSHGDDGVAVIMRTHTGNNSVDIVIAGLKGVCFSCWGGCWWWWWN